VTVINVGGAYTVHPGETWGTLALVLVPLKDEWTASPPSGVTARALSPNTHAHVTGGHLVITGLPGRALPGLASGPVELTVELRRPGRPPQRVAITVPQASTLPYRAPALAVASTPISLVGRVSAAAFPHAAVVGASVAISGGATPLLALPAPLALGHPAGTTVRERALSSGPGTTLLVPVRGGDGVLSVASVAGLTAGSLLAIGPELVVVDAVEGQFVMLRTPASRSAPAGAPVTALTAGVTGASTTLSRDALPGDGVLPVGGNIGGPAVEILDGAATEYRRTALTTGADGRWRLSGVRGIPEITLTTSAAGFLTDGPRLYPLAPLDPYVLSIALRT
jgi:hypothetical protein